MLNKHYICYRGQVIVNHWLFHDFFFFQVFLAHCVGLQHVGMFTYPYSLFLPLGVYFRAEVSIFRRAQSKGLCVLTQ